MAVYRTALGRNVDMGALVSRNEKVRAVGNMKVNARGDTIDSNNKVIKPITEKVNDKYSRTVGNTSAQIIKPDKQGKLSKPIINEDLTPQERELEDSFDDDLEIEQIKAKEMSKKNGK